MNKSLDLLQKAASLLLREKFFYYGLYAQFRIRETDKCPTMGVSWVDGAYHLVYNPDFIALYTPRELMYILEHECNHFCFDHVKEFKTSGIKRSFKTPEEAKDYIKQRNLESYEHKIRNIAMDCSINQYVPKLPKIRQTMEDVLRGAKTPEDIEKRLKDATVLEDTGDPKTTIVESDCITLESFKRILTESGYQGNVNDVKAYERWRYYYDLLMSSPNAKEAVQNIQDMDIHFSTDGDAPEGEAEKIIIESFKQVNENGGTLPGHLKGLVDLAIDKLTPKGIPWNRMLRKMLNNAIKTKMESDINRRSRTVPTDVKSIITGYTNRPLFKIGVVLDVSGSFMSPDDQAMAWAEVQALVKAGGELTIYYTDADVEHTQRISPYKTVTVEDYQGKGGGGTDLDKGIVRAIAEKQDIIVMLTDGMTPWNLTRKDLGGKKVIVVTTYEEPPKHYGYCIKVESKH